VVGVLALVIDTSSAAVTAGIVEVGDVMRVLAQRVTIDARAHGELLAPSIRDSLAEAGARMSDLAAVVAGVGPGPFTGLRVGLVTAAAIADARGLPSYPVCSLDALAAAHPGQPRLLAAGDARRKEIYWALYDQGVRLAGPAVGRAADLPEDLAPTAAVGAGAELYSDVLDLVPLPGGYPTVAGLAAVAAARLRDRAPGEALTPLYLRRPDAQVPAPAKAVTGP
jgi:tRNA threonylcarbamoyl adenosine modification protein YeaZ